MSRLAIPILLWLGVCQAFAASSAISYSRQVMESLRQKQPTGALIMTKRKLERLAWVADDVRERYEAMSVADSEQLLADFNSETRRTLDRADLSGLDDIEVTAAIVSPGGDREVQGGSFLTLLTATVNGKRGFHQLAFEAAKTGRSWVGVKSLRLEETMPPGSARRLRDTERDIRRFQEDVTALKRERRQLLIRAKGNITCNYGNRGGSCEIREPFASYTFSLSSENPVDWYFEGKKLPTAREPDVDIVIPTFESDALTHFENCTAEVIRGQGRTDVRISLDGCVHAPEIYAPLMQQPE